MRTPSTTASISEFSSSLPTNSLTQSETFDMVRKRKHVYRLHRDQVVALRTEEMQITGKSRRVARNVDQRPWPQLPDLGKGSRETAGTWRIYHRDIYAPVVPEHVPKR